MKNSVLKSFSAEHTGWKGTVLLFNDGTFRGGLYKPDGRWSWKGPMLSLKWYNWPETKLRPTGFGHYISIDDSDKLVLHELISEKQQPQTSLCDSDIGHKAEDFTKEEIYLNLGCGANILAPPWRNHDMDMDITRALPFEASVVSRILVEHVIEHIDGPACLRFFDECYRVLKPGGVLRVCVPIISSLKGIHLRSIILNHGHKIFFCELTLHTVLQAAGFAVAQIKTTGFKDCDGHWKIIGKELDMLETCRTEAIK
jgi:SAM-dependent methyltransferase